LGNRVADCIATVAPHVTRLLGRARENGVRPTMVDPTRALLALQWCSCVGVCDGPHQNAAAMTTYGLQTWRRSNQYHQQPASRGMAPFPAWLLWPLRKAAIIPVVGITLGAASALYGSFDLSRRVLAFAAPPHQPRRTGSNAVAYSAAAALAGTVIGAREMLFKPVIPQAPDLPLDGVPLQVRLRNASVLAMHAVVNYPYRFRFGTSFAAGVAGAVGYVVADRLYNGPAGRGKATAAAGGAKQPGASTAVAVPATRGAAGELSIEGGDDRDPFAPDVGRDDAEDQEGGAPSHSHGAMASSGSASRGRASSRGFNSGVGAVPDHDDDGAADGEPARASDAWGGEGGVNDSGDPYARAASAGGGAGAGGSAVGERYVDDPYDGRSSSGGSSRGVRR
jgi:hypothetical protein